MLIISGRAYIKCDRILDACLNILKDSRLTKAIGDAYLNLLHKHVLTCEHYLGYITPANWEGNINNNYVEEYLHSDTLGVYLDVKKINRYFVDLDHGFFFFQICWMYACLYACQKIPNWIILPSLGFCP